MDPREFSDQVLRHIPRATAGERKSIREELEAHMEDHAAALWAQGHSPEGAQAPVNYRVELLCYDRTGGILFRQELDHGQIHRLERPIRAWPGPG